MNNPTPLAGVTVLEFSHTIMGPCAGLVLADLGARVIKIEPAPDGDRTRQLPGFAAGFFATFNRNKQSLAVDLKTDDGKKIIHALTAEADVVIENYGPGTMERLGCSWETLRALNPRLVYLALKGFLHGPWENRPALDEVVQFQSGLAYMTGPEGQPLRAGASVVDILGAVFGCTGVLAALRERDTTGIGQRVGSALFESAAFMMASHMAGGVTTGQTIPPMTARKGAWGVYDVFRTREGKQLFIGVTSDKQWTRFCKHFAFEDLAADKSIANNAQRVTERDTLIPKLNQRIATLAYDDAVRCCEEADVSWAPVARPEDLYDCEQLLPRGLLDIIIQSDGNRPDLQALLPGLPLEFGPERERTRVVTQPPLTGQHTTEILSEFGFEPQQIHQWLQTRTVLETSG